MLDGTPLGASHVPRTPTHSPRVLSLSSPLSPMSGIEEEEPQPQEPRPQQQYLSLSNDKKDRIIFREVAERVEIPTAFNPSHAKNRQMPLPPPGPDREKWTQKQRKQASKAKVPVSVNELRSEVSVSASPHSYYDLKEIYILTQLNGKFYTKDGVKRKQNSYIRADEYVFAG